MNKLFSTIAACLFVLFTSNISHAHPGGHDHGPDLRVWKDADGLFEIEAFFMLAKDDQVQLCKHDGSIVCVPLGKLSANDRDWVRQKLAEIRALNTPAESLPLAEDVRTASSRRNIELSAIAIGALVVLAFLDFILRRKALAVRVMVPLLAVVGPLSLLAVAQGPEAKKTPLVQKHFEPFKDKLRFRSDEKYFYIESNGMPDHRMMVGITAWQQQVPMPQAYTGRNAWQIPLFPKLSDKPVSAKKELFRGAIALAANGVPIFNPIKNDGRTDTFLAGELDEYGGHCGRGDDYHYHIAPIHLEKLVGKGNPLGYALDGFPLYGYTDATGKEPKDLDEFNGRMEKDGYRYYSTKTYPYVNGGLRGEVTVKDDQIDPQPRAYSPRPALTPLRGAKITGFEHDDAKKSVTVKYEVNGKAGSVKYIATAEKYEFQFTDTSGKVTTESYPIREDGKRPPPKKDGPPKKDNPPKKDGPPPPRTDGPPMKDELPPPKPVVSDTFKLTSPAFAAGGKMPVEFSGDGDGISPPLAWNGAPAGTKFYALQLWHIPGPGEVKSYWVIYNIPANVSKLEKGSKGVGTAGYNDKNRNDYDPMKSKGPGAKEYHITMYALSAEPKFTGEKVTRADLLKSIKDITLAETTLTCTFERVAK